MLLPHPSTMSPHVLNCAAHVVGVQFPASLPVLLLLPHATPTARTKKKEK
jgi:hypothetical protein